MRSSCPFKIIWTGELGANPVPNTWTVDPGGAAKCDAPALVPKEDVIGVFGKIGVGVTGLVGNIGLVGNVGFGNGFIGLGLMIGFIFGLFGLKFVGKLVGIWFKKKH